MSTVLEQPGSGRRRPSAVAVLLIATALAAAWAVDGRVAAHEPATANEPAAMALAAASETTATPAAATAGASEFADGSDVAASVAVVDLGGDLTGMVNVDGWRNDAWAVLVVSLDHGDTLFAHHADRVLAPASNLKLFTSASALYYLGPDYRYGTYLATDARLEDGVLLGDLHLYGTGDPTLSDRFLDTDMDVWTAFADTLAALGVREVRGAVVGDGSYFEGPMTGAGWQDSYINAWYAAPAGALSFNDNMITLRLQPAEQPGWRPEVLLVPGGAGVAMVNLAMTVDGSGSDIHVTRAGYDGPIVIRGEIGLGSRGTWHGVPVPDPARYTAAVFREILEGRGIRITGGIRSNHDPERSIFAERTVFAAGFDDGESPRVLAVHRSPRLLDILEVVNKQSHNLYAEQVLRTVGRAVAGSGSIAGGERAVELMIRRENGAMAAPTLEMVDGSGLSVLDRASPGDIIALLALMSRSHMFGYYLATLPTAGERGLRRMGGTAAQGNLRAKTGTINNVSALSGYVTAANGERLAFSIISNRVPSTWRAKRVEDRIGARLAAFSRPLPPPGAVAARSATGGAQAAGAAPSPDTAAPSGIAEPTPDTTVRPGPAPAPSATADAARAAEAAAAARARHVIRSGDTLEGIARTYGTTVSALREANPGLNPRRLIPGREVRLP